MRALAWIAENWGLVALFVVPLIISGAAIVVLDRTSDADLTDNLPDDEDAAQREFVDRWHAKHRRSGRGW